MELGATARVVVANRTGAGPVRRRLPRPGGRCRSAARALRHLGRSSTSTRTRGARRSRRRPANDCPAGPDPRSGGTAHPAGRRSTAARRGAMPPASASSVPRCGRRSARSGPTAAGPDGVGIRTRYAAMVGHVATRFAREPAVAGYDVMNEPNAFAPAELQGLSRPVRATRSRRSAPVKRTAGGFAHLVFFEPGARGPTPSRGAAAVRARRQRRVLAAHLSRWVDVRADAAVRLRTRAHATPRPSAARRCSSASGGADPSAPRIRPTCTSAEHQQLQDEFHFSADAVDVARVVR